MGIRKNGGISGTVGTIVTYQLRGKEVVRSLPDQVRQTKATKASAKDFGKIKKISRFLRKGLSGVLPTFKSMPVMFTMDEAVRRWYHEFYRKPEISDMNPDFFNNLELKPGVSAFAEELLGAQPIVVWSENRVELQIPAMSHEFLMQLNGLNIISFCLIVSGAVIDEKEDISLVGRKSHSIDKTVENNGIETFSLVIDDFPRPLQGLSVAYLSLRYKRYHQWQDSESSKPVVVVGSWFNGVRPEVELKIQTEDEES